VRRALSGFAPGIIFCLALLAGCATVRSDRTQLSWAEQTTLLANLPAYGLSGRVAVRAGQEGWQANTQWRQHADISEVELSGPFGAGSMLLRLSGDELQVVDSQGEILRGDQATELLTRRLGFAPPLSALRYWLLALPAPAGGAAIPSYAADGTLTQLEQQGWQLSYEGYRSETAAGGTVRLPARLTATRGEVRLRLVVDRWQLRPESR
jgi:outer membrane lipoprotein LolB